MKLVGPKQYFKIENGGVLVGLFQCNSPYVIDIQIKMFSDMTVTEVYGNEYQRLQETANWK